MRHAKILMTQYFPMNWGIIATFATESKRFLRHHQIFESFFVLK